MNQNNADSRILSDSLRSDTAPSEASPFSFVRFGKSARQTKKRVGLWIASGSHSSLRTCSLSHFFNASPSARFKKLPLFAIWGDRRRNSQLRRINAAQILVLLIDLDEIKATIVGDPFAIETLRAPTQQFIVEPGTYAAKESFQRTPGSNDKGCFGISCLIPLTIKANSGYRSV